jgi:hypothetical protein
LHDSVHMRFMRFKLLLRAVALLAMLVTIATRSSHADSPCPPFAAIPQTGTLLEVRAGTTGAAVDASLLNEIPQHMCVSPTSPSTARAR